MIDWTYLDTALQVPPTLLNPDKLLVAQGHIARGESVIIGHLEIYELSALTCISIFYHPG